MLDIVLAHQAAGLKSELVQQLMSALVLPAPQHYRPQLRRLAGLSGARRGRGRGSAVRGLARGSGYPASAVALPARSVR